MNEALVKKLTQSLAPGSLSSLAERKRAENRRFLLEDCSGSMAEHCEPGRPKIEALRDIVKHLQAEGVGFKQIAFGAIGTSFVTSPPHPSGGTPLHEALRLARINQAERVVIISDGIPDSEDLARQEASALGCPIDIFYVGPSRHQGEVFLRSLAKMTKGEYQSTSLAKDGMKQVTSGVKRLLMLPAGRS